jgi:hypothetical protein
VKSSIICAPLEITMAGAALAKDITVVVTSCNRHDLLERTLRSFLAHETERRIARILVAEDGDADPSKLCEKFGAEHFMTGSRVGQIKLIDMAYAKVTTPYIFHLEDDWEFYRSGFMERSREFLEANPKILLVNLRSWDLPKGHPLSGHAVDRSCGILAWGFNGIWHGFTFNPGLRRLADYKLLPGGFGGQALTVKLLQKVPSAALPYEAEASMFYRSHEFVVAILDETGFMRHIGEQRHITHGDDRQSVDPGALCFCGSRRRYGDCHGR